MAGPVADYSIMTNKVDVGDRGRGNQDTRVKELEAMQMVR